MCLLIISRFVRILNVWFLQALKKNVLFASICPNKDKLGNSEVNTRPPRHEDICLTLPHIAFTSLKVRTRGGGGGRRSVCFQVRNKVHSSDMLPVSESALISWGMFQYFAPTFLTATVLHKGRVVCTCIEWRINRFWAQLQTSRTTMQKRTIRQETFLVEVPVFLGSNTRKVSVMCKPALSFLFIFGTTSTGYNFKASAHHRRWRIVSRSQRRNQGSKLYRKHEPQRIWHS